MNWYRATQRNLRGSPLLVENTRALRAVLADPHDHDAWLDLARDTLRRGTTMPAEVYPLLHEMGGSDAFAAWTKRAATQVLVALDAAAPPAIDRNTPAMRIIARRIASRTKTPADRALLVAHFRELGPAFHHALYMRARDNRRPGESEVIIRAYVNAARQDHFPPIANLVRWSDYEDLLALLAARNPRLAALLPDTFSDEIDELTSRMALVTEERWSEMYQELITAVNHLHTLPPQRQDFDSSWHGPLEEYLRSYSTLNLRLNNETAMQARFEAEAYVPVLLNGGATWVNLANLTDPPDDMEVAERALDVVMRMGVLDSPDEALEELVDLNTLLSLEFTLALDGDPDDADDIRVRVDVEIESYRNAVDVEPLEFGEVFNTWLDDHREVAAYGDTCEFLLSDWEDGMSVLADYCNYLRQTIQRTW